MSRYKPGESTRELPPDLKLGANAAAFAIARLGFLPDPWQVAVLRWYGRRLLMNCCRQSGKSTTIAIRALHHALYNPGSLILLVSPSLRQSTELFRKVTAFMRRLRVRPELTEDNRLTLQLASGSRIVSLPSSEATIRGFSSPSLIIEDEASRVPDELHFALRPMLAVSDGVLVLMSTPYGKRGHFYEEWANGGSDWERVSVSASQCPRISKVFLEQERRALGERFFSQEYECEFRDTIDQVFPTDLIAQALSDDVKPLFDQSL